MTDRVARNALERAIDDSEQLLLLYQPIHHTRTRALYAAEALLRQRRQSGEIRETSIIQEAAEESSRSELFRFDSIVVKKAYTDAARWQTIGPAVRLNVNLSPREFQEGDVLERLMSLVSACGIDPTRINLEITETSYIQNPEETMHVLNELRDRGMSLWLDDFGTGHSSLAHLQHFPVAGVKLPGSFVRPLPEDDRCRAITRAVVQLAHDLGLAVIAEEVEREEQLDLLDELGCEYIQGFLLSKPMPAEELEQMLRRSGSVTQP